MENILDSTIATLIAGMLGYMGMWCAGRWLTQCRKNLHTPGPLCGPLSVLTGLLINAMACFMWGLTGFAGQIGLSLLLSFWIVLGGIECTKRLMRRDAFSLMDRSRVGMCLLWLFCLLPALAPTTKIDELHYHMLLPRRLVEDGELLFYAFPWHAAIIPQMLYQLGCAPFHAVGIPDSGNVISALLFLEWWTMLFMVAQKRCDGRECRLLLLFGGGLYAPVWMATGGSHAMGHLASGALVSGHLLAKDSAWTNRVVAMSIFALSAVTSKVIFLPLAGMSLLLILWEERSRIANKEWVNLCLSWGVPWVLVYLPVLVWTYVQSGSPYGPMFTNIFGTTAYDPQLVAGMFERITSSNQPDLSWKALLRLGALFPFGFWAGCLLFPLTARGLALRTGVFLFLVQFAVIVTVTQFDLRFLGGVPWTLAGWGLILTENRFRELKMWRNWCLPGLVLMLSPWIVVQAVYTWPAIHCALGFQSREEYREEQVAFYEDYRELEARLPSESILVYRGVRLNSFYAPFPVRSHHDLSPISDEPHFLFHVGDELNPLPGYQMQSLLYENPRAKTQVLRTPGAEDPTGRLRVYPLIPDTGYQPHAD